MSMLGRYYIFLSISRYIRSVYFCVVIIRYHELGDGDVDRQIKVIVMTLILMVVVSSGVFVEIENSQNLIELSKDGIPIFEPGFKPLGFHEGLYFVVVTLFTVGYGDINAVNNLSKICTLLLILLTIGIMPQ